MADGLRTIQGLHDAVRRAAKNVPFPDPAEIARIVLAERGIPATAVHPLVVRSVEAHLKLLDVTVLPG
jgi:hypothetical protein